MMSTIRKKIRPCYRQPGGSKGLCCLRYGSDPTPPLQRWLGPTWRNHLDLDPVGILAEHCVVPWTASVRIAIFVQQRVARCLNPGSQLVNVRSRLALEGKVIEPHALPVVSDSLMLLRSWKEAQVRLTVSDVVHSTRPTIRFVPEPLHKWRPELNRTIQIAYVNLDVMQHGIPPYLALAACSPSPLLVIRFTVTQQTAKQERLLTVPRTSQRCYSQLNFNPSISHMPGVSDRMCKVYGMRPTPSP